MENLLYCDENVSPNIYLQKSPLKQSSLLSSSSSSSKKSLQSPLKRSSPLITSITPPEIVTPIKRITNYNPYESPSITRLEDYLQEKEQIFLDQIRSPKKSPSRSPLKQINCTTPPKTNVKTVRINESVNRYRLFDKDSATQDHSLTFNYSASKSAESLYRQPIKPSISSSLSSSSSPSTTTTSPVKKRQIRLPVQFFNQNESLARLSRNTTKNINTISNTSNTNISNKIKVNYNFTNIINIVTTLSILIYLITYMNISADNNNNNNNNNKIWFTRIEQSRYNYQVDIYNPNTMYNIDSNTFIIVDTNTISNTIANIINNYVEQPFYHFINLIFEDNSKALVLVNTNEMNYNYQYPKYVVDTIINIIPSDGLCLSYESYRIEVDQLNIITMMTSIYAAVSFILSRR